MSDHDASLPAHWQFYADRSLEAHFGWADDFGLGREEQLWETLYAIQNDEPFTDECRHRLDRVPRNRAKKHRRLRLRLKSMAHGHRGEMMSQVESCDAAAALRRSMTPEQRVIEDRLAKGQTYSELAREWGESTAVLKMRVSRWRAELRRRVAPRWALQEQCPLAEAV